MVRRQDRDGIHEAWLFEHADTPDPIPILLPGVPLVNSIWTLGFPVA